MISRYEVSEDPGETKLELGGIDEVGHEKCEHEGETVVKKVCSLSKA